MRPILLGSLLAVLIASPARAAGPAIIPLAKDGPWVANYDADSCQLLAKFGSGRETIVAQFSRYSPEDRFDLVLTGDPLKRGESSENLKVAFGPGQAMLERSALVGTQGGKAVLIFNSQRLDGWSIPLDQPEAIAPVISPEQEDRISNFTIQLNRSKAYRLELGSMRRPMAEMRKCMDTLLSHWGYDPSVIATLSRPPTPTDNPGNWATSTDYPSKALRKRLEGIVQFRLDVDEAGHVAGCRILARTDPDEFSVQTCKVLSRRARFYPALDAAGKPVKSFYVNKVRFMMGY